MPNCSICGKPVAKVPSWLDSVSATFRCSECPGTAIGISPTFADLDDDEKDDDVVPEIEVESLEAMEELETEDEPIDDED